MRRYQYSLELKSHQCPAGAGSKRGNAEMEAQAGAEVEPPRGKRIRKASKRQQEADDASNEQRKVCEGPLTQVGCHVMRGFWRYLHELEPLPVPACMAGARVLGIEV